MSKKKWGEIIMSFIENFKTKAGIVMDKGADKAKDIAEITKLNRNISLEEKQINASFLELGKIYFEKQENNIDDENKEIINKIKVSKAAIEEMKDLIVKVKTKTKVDDKADATEDTVVDTVNAEASQNDNESTSTTENTQTTETTQSTENQ